MNPFKHPSMWPDWLGGRAFWAAISVFYLVGIPVLIFAAAT
ncbi:hypothetical protein OPTIMUS_47 [Mycobacterium phage Optimus]|uniref:Uncharacterized protein n=2 Tax=Omegavirus TaxID=1623292 RepID=G1DAI6_9CAUD|nr:hypothetical protein FDG54_gp047 [Mycobacterium phage Optimus]YP_009636217.1 hypothetical protein FGG20_gp046 [Mycobacterium phage Baka]QGJ88199.1 hypothetical protein PBI_STANNES_26 [Mycobacterium phage StAnnes]QGJ93681.1 hypothetical protein SEA_HANNACONDA_40 [Mycobacterium phage Hannaconda]QPO16646.1 membrane protein [Mycobacterium phage KashFlow]AEJ92127.1 hypothetical protein OPTIMUS_47 [Mycobacterium phage Optimus]AEK08103.1 hypothetical protein PBI_BAKA_46 [Mycobacterium phage Baka]